jgi:hypothetical protein
VNHHEYDPVTTMASHAHHLRGVPIARASHVRAHQLAITPLIRVRSYTAYVGDRRGKSSEPWRSRARRRKPRIGLSYPFFTFRLGSQRGSPAAAVA